MNITTYKGYGIDHNIYGQGEYSVQYCGDDCLFKTIAEAKQYIDEIVAYERKAEGDWT